MLPKLALGVLALALMMPPAGSLGLADAKSLTLRADQVPDEVIFGFAGAVPEDAESWVASLGGQMLTRNDAIHFVTARFGSAAAAEDALLAAHARSDVRYAERDGLTAADFVPNDPLYPNQWGYPAIQAPAAWDVTLGSKSVKVAVLDTGVDLGHVDLVGNLCGPHKAFDGAPTAQDFHFHGTHTSGTVGAVSNNGIGVAGTSQSCLMAGKVLGNGGGGQWSWLASGLTWAADNGAHVISMSLGGGQPPQSVQDAVRYAYNDKNVLLVASAGNSGCGTDTIGFPAKYDEVQAVAALEPPNGMFTAGYSSCGPDMEIAAPGSSVLSTTLRNGYGSASGTSMAAPHVSGVAALVKAKVPAISAHDLRCLLNLSSDDLGIPLRDPQSGWGRVDARNALDMHASLTAQGLWDDFQALCLAGAPLIMY